jgi:hypothetical protein
MIIGQRYLNLSIIDDDEIPFIGRGIGNPMILR